MSAYLSLVEEDQESQNDQQIKTFSNACRIKLQEWIRASASQVPAKERQFVSELHDVVPKICAALVALKGDIDTRTILLKRLADARQKWGMLINSSSPKAVITSCVIRDILFANVDFWNEIPGAHDACRFLIQSVDHEHSPAKRLMILNSLLDLSLTVPPKAVNDFTTRAMVPWKLRAKMRKVLREVLDTLRSKPFSVPNPLIEDEVHGSRCRYVRYSTDLIILESLYQISGEHVSYLEADLGKHLSQALIRALEFTAPLTECRNTCGERLSFSTAIFTDRVLRTIDKPRPISHTPIPVIATIGIAGFLPFIFPLLRGHREWQVAAACFLVIAAMMVVTFIGVLPSTIRKKAKRLARFLLTGSPAAQLAWTMVLRPKRLAAVGLVLVVTVALIMVLYPTEHPIRQGVAVGAITGLLTSYADRLSSKLFSVIKHD